MHNVRDVLEAPAERERFLIADLTLAFQHGRVNKPEPKPNTNSVTILACECIRMLELCGFTPVNLLDLVWCVILDPTYAATYRMQDVADITDEDVVVAVLNYEGKYFEVDWDHMHIARIGVNSADISVGYYSTLFGNVENLTRIETLCLKRLHPIYSTAYLCATHLRQLLPKKLHFGMWREYIRHCCDNGIMSQQTDGSIHVHKDKVHNSVELLYTKFKPRTRLYDKPNWERKLESKQKRAECEARRAAVITRPFLQDLEHSAESQCIRLAKIVGEFDLGVSDARSDCQIDIELVRRIDDSITALHLLGFTVVNIYDLASIATDGTDWTVRQAGLAIREYDGSYFKVDWAAKTIDKIGVGFSTSYHTMFPPHMEAIGEQISYLHPEYATAYRCMEHIKKLMPGMPLGSITDYVWKVAIPKGEMVVLADGRVVRNS